MKRYILAITGATGSILGLRILKTLIKEADVHLILSEPAISIMKEEVGIDLSERPEERLRNMIREEESKGESSSMGRLSLYNEKNLWAPLSSGSFLTDGMLVVPCSMKTLSAIANGYADGLVERAADVTIKEGRPLILSPRETPLSAIHLENMLKLSRVGVRIVPPMFGFYHKPEGVDEMVDFIAGKILDQLQIDHRLYKRWQ